MKTLASISIPVLMLAAAAGSSACESVRSKPGPDGTAYSLGTLDGLLRATPQKVVAATESALKEMDIGIVTAAASGVDGKVVARTALDRRIEIVVRRQDPETSKISIQAGSFGDRQLSREIYEAIKAKL